MKESAYKKALEQKKKKQQDEFLGNVAIHLSLHQQLMGSSNKQNHQPLESDVDTYKLFTSPD